MTFMAPERLWLLLGLVVLVALYLLAQRRRRRHAVRFAALPLLARVAPNPGWRRHLSAVVFLAMAAALVLAFARPEADVRVPREEATVVVVLDLSGSMKATDVSPDRFTVAQEAAIRFVDQLPSRYRVALVPFSTQASIAVAPTTDHALVSQTIGGLTARGATAIGDALITSVQATRRPAEPAGGQVAPGDGQAENVPTRVVLLSDGANSRGVPVEDGIAAAVAAGVQVSTIAYGTDAGSVGGQAVPVDRVTLGEIASETGGEAYEAASAAELEEVYEDLGSSLGFRIERAEVTSWLVGAGLVLALLAAALSLRFTGRLP